MSTFGRDSTGAARTPKFGETKRTRLSTPPNLYQKGFRFAKISRQKMATIVSRGVKWRRPPRRRPPPPRPPTTPRPPPFLDV